MAKFGLLIYDKDHWADVAGFTESNLPPTWTLEKFPARYRRGDVVQVIAEANIPPGTANMDNTPFKLLILDDADGFTYEQAREKYHVADDVAEPTAENPDQRRMLSRSIYTVDLALATGRTASDLTAQGMADTTPTDVATMESDKTLTR